MKNDLLASVPPKLLSDGSTTPRSMESPDAFPKLYSLDYKPINKDYTKLNNLEDPFDTPLQSSVGKKIYQEYKPKDIIPPVEQVVSSVNIIEDDYNPGF